MDKNQIQSFERAALYEIFASFYLQIPTIDTVQGIPSMLQEASKVLSSVDFEPLIEEAQGRNKLVDDDDKHIKFLQQQYYDHFFIPSTKNYIPPYESAVVEAVIKEGRKNTKWKYGSLWSNSTYHVSMCYDSVKFNPWDLNIEEGLKQSKVPDHIGFQLAFMAYLCHKETICNELALENNPKVEKEKEAAEKWNKLQKQFLEEHLQKFVLSYCEIAKEKCNPFYLQVINTVRDYIEWDLAARVI